MFDRLHPKMRRIGEVELVQPSIELYMQVALVSGKNVVFFSPEKITFISVKKLLLFSPSDVTDA